MEPTYKARPTTYKGIQMRSRLEAGFAMWLDQQGFRWDYEPGAFADETGQYLPDFRIHDLWCAWLDRPATAYVEVKYASWPGTDVDSEEWMEKHHDLMCGMAILHRSEPDAVLLLAQPEQDVIYVEERERTIGQAVGIVEPDEYARPMWPNLGTWVRRGRDQPAGVAYLAEGPWPHEWWKRSA